jgi:hypothetical protein
MQIFSFLVQSHSIVRYVALLFLIIAIVSSLAAVLGKKSYTAQNSKTSLWAMAVFHIQVLLGLALYVLSPNVQFTAETMKSDALRFYTVEHIFLMLISVVLITIGYVRGKKRPESGNKQILIFYTIAFILVLLAIPWPFREALGAKWF